MDKGLHLEILKISTCFETLSFGRIIAISFLSKAFGLPQKNYEPYAWISNVDKIKWTSLEMDNFPVGGMVAGIFLFFDLTSGCLEINLSL